MSDIHIRAEGRIGRITLTRPKALNALTYQMCLDIEAALDAWADDDEIACVLIDAEGERAFCAGGDLQQLFETGRDGDYAYGRQFWADEYRLNAKIFNFPKPYIALMQGFTMGGGVGVACHGSHRVVGRSSRIAMPECGVGLVPDVGGSWILGKAPGRLGEFLGTTGTRMNASDALLAGFADYFIPETKWPELTEALVETGDWSVIDTMAEDPADGPLMEMRERIDAEFAGATIQDVLRGLTDDVFSRDVRSAIARNSPLSVGCALELIRRVRPFERIEPALEMEYRFTYRASEEGDFIEGIRAAIIDKDRNPRWRHSSIDTLTSLDVSRMLMPLGPNALSLASLEGRG